ncbi:MAG: tRNA (adenosine(37)-N6)-threonylcarbamoyltransferase complex ATPase subunit type 1 TsaE [Acidimicrobiales bacterium]
MTPPSLRCLSPSPAVTAVLAASVAEQLRDGDLLVLAGDLGAGKTAFTKGLCAALDVDATVTSPTFTLANRYEGRLAVNHLDVYRIDDPAEVADLAIDELLDDGVTVIEWGDRIESVLPTHRLCLRFTLGESDDDRIIDLVAGSPDWWERVQAIRRADTIEWVR